MRGLALIALASCGPSQAGGTTADADVPGCTKSAFGAPRALDGIVGNASDPTATHDPLELWFSRSGIVPTYDIAGARRTSTTSAFETPVDFMHNSGGSDRDPAFSGDGLVLVLVSDRGGSLGVYESRRASTTAAFSAPVQLQLDIDARVDNGIELSADGLTLYVADAAGDLRAMTRPDRGAPFGRLSDVIAAGISAPSLSADERELYYVRTDSAGTYRRTRASKDGAFDGAETLVLADAVEPDLAPDGERLYVRLADFMELTRSCD